MQNTVTREPYPKTVERKPYRETIFKKPYPKNCMRRTVPKHFDQRTDPEKYVQKMLSRKRHRKDFYQNLQTKYEKKLIPKTETNNFKQNPKPRIKNQGNKIK
jgi:hypothetical protein